MDRTRRFQIVYAGLTNLYHSTTYLARGTMTNERKQSALSKARSFKQFKTTRSPLVHMLSHTTAAILQYVELYSLSVIPAIEHADEAV